MRLEMTFLHSPEYFQFTFQDPAAGVVPLRQLDYDALNRNRFVSRDQCLLIGVISEFEPIPIELAYLESYCAVDDIGSWDRIVECPINSSSGEFVLAGCPDGPVAGVFGVLKVKPGDYRVRVCYGRQDSDSEMGGDFYRIVIWPSTYSLPCILKNEN